MKNFDKVTFVFWILNIIGIIMFPILAFVVFNQEVISETMMTLHYIIWYPIIIFWIYNIWFFYKYDRYSSAIFFLFVFNVFYSPFYYYKVKIKKRPLKNKIDYDKSESVFDKIVVNDEVDNNLEEEMNSNNR